MKKVLAAAVMSLILAASAQAAIITSGNVEPEDPSTWTAGTAGYVGHTEDGSMEINGSSTVLSRLSMIGGGSGITGTAIVTGSGSTWTFSENFTVGTWGNGTLTVTAGGTVSKADDYADLIIGDWGGSGTLTISAGGTVSNTNGTIAKRPDIVSTATVTGANSQWTNTNTLMVGTGNNSNTTLSIENGGTVSDINGTIAYGTDSVATVTVTGTNSQWTNTSYFTIGYDGNCTLTIADGGVVSSTYTTIASQTGTTSSTVITGANSQLTSSEWLQVGSGGTGILHISNGAIVSDTYGYIGGTGDSVCTATVTDANSQWINEGDFTVGVYNYGSGILFIENGGLVSNVNGNIGKNGLSNGAATVTGAGSQWTSSGSLFVGKGGRGELTITDGAVVSNTATGYIGYDGLSSGVVTVSGSGSTWTNNDDLIVGRDDSGMLNISNGGLVSVAGTLTIEYYIGYGDGLIKMADGGMLALNDSGWTSGDDLTDFLALLDPGYGEIRYYNGTDWADITGATQGVDYTLEHRTAGDLAGYTVLTVHAEACIVNLEDYVVFASHWLDSPCSAANNWCDGADLDQLGDVNIDDLIILVENWFDFCPDS